MTPEDEVTDGENQDESFLNDVEDTGMPVYIFIIICVLVLLFFGIGIYICILLRRNKSDRELHERAIAHELEVARREGVEIPDDLEKRIGDFTKSTNSGKSGGKGAKVHPELSKS